MPGLGTAFISSLVGLLGLFLVASNTWWHPAIIVCLGLVFVTGPAVGLAILFSELREDRDLQSLMPVVGVALAVGVGGSALWFLTETRVLAIRTFGESASIEEALKESNLDIQVAACRRSFEVDGGVEASTKAMIAQPAIARDCLPTSKGPRVRQVEYNVASLWYSRLMAPTPQDPGMMCSYAQTMDTFTSRVQDHQDLRMMNCALNASDQKTRVCCAGVLQARGQTGEQLSAMLSNDLEQTVRHHIPGPLVGLSYGERGTTARLSMVQDMLAMPLKKMKDSSLSLACQGLARYEEGEHARPYLDWLLGEDESQTCMTPVQIQESRNIAMMDVCDRLMNEESKRFGEARVCNALLTEVKQEQIARLERAQRNAKNIADMTDGIKLGHNNQIAQRNTLDGMMGSFQGMMNGQPQYGNRPYVEGHTLETEAQQEARLLKQLEGRVGADFSKMNRARVKELSKSVDNVDMDAARALVKSVQRDGFNGKPNAEQIRASSAMTRNVERAKGSVVSATSKDTANKAKPTNQIGRNIRINP